MAVGIQITLNERLYLRDPQQTELGRRIIQHSILLIDQIGFEAFTFKIGFGNAVYEKLQYIDILKINTCYYCIWCPGFGSGSTI